MTTPPVDRAAIAAELEASRRRLHELLAGAGAADLRRASRGTRWTNEELLFHMVFGFLVVRTLLPLVRLMGRLPAPVGRGFAAALDSTRRPFHVVNFWGSRAGARVFSARRMGGLCDRVVAALTRSLEREPEENLRRGMPFPVSWDPYFTSFMTLADVYRYPNLHFEHHRRQLTLSAGGASDPLPHQPTGGTLAPVAHSGSTIGTVIRWDDESHSGLVEAPDLPAPCWVDASAIAGDDALRAGQVVEVDWTDTEQGDAPLSATRVLHRPDLQTGLGG